MIWTGNFVNVNKMYKTTVDGSVAYLNNYSTGKIQNFQKYATIPSKPVKSKSWNELVTTKKHNWVSKAEIRKNSKLGCSSTVGSYKLCLITLFSVGSGEFLKSFRINLVSFRTFRHIPQTISCLGLFLPLLVTWWL